MPVEEVAGVAAVFIAGLVGGLGLIIVIGVKLWKGIGELIGFLKAALEGDRDRGDEPGDDDDDDGSPSRGRRRLKAGSFQFAVREELEAVLSPLERRFDGLERAISEVGDRQADVEATARTHSNLIADLSRSHNVVARRTNEHSAALNIADAEQTMTQGAVQR